jgi:hypothetical protein
MTKEKKRHRRNISRKKSRKIRNKKEKRRA